MKRALFFGTLLALICLPLPGSAQTRQKAVAVIDFENVNKEKALDWLGTGIAETLTTQLSHMREISVVERTRLHDALKEIKFNRSEFVDPNTARHVGRVVGADSIVLGAYQKFEDQIRLTARLVDVETGKVAAPTRVDGNYKEIFTLQDSLAANLAREIKGTLAETDRQQLQAPRAAGLEAYQFFSDGVYYLRNGLVDDALAQFDQALKVDPAYGEAHFYRGLALQKRQRWDEAIAAFKRALPRSQPVRHIKWSWDVPYEGERSKRGRMLVLDFKDLTLQDIFFKTGIVKLPPRLIYTERVGKKTILHLTDLEQRASKRLEIPDDEIQLFQIVTGTDRVVLVESRGEMPLGIAPEKIVLYGIGVADGNLWWRGELKRLGGREPLSAVIGDNFFVYFPASRRLMLADDATWTKKWEREIEISLFNPPRFRRSKLHGEIMVLRSPEEKKLRVVRVSDGTDVWIADLKTREADLLVEGELVVTLESDKRVAAYDLDTGKVLVDLSVRPWAFSVDTMLGSLPIIPALLKEGVLYFLSKERELYAVDLKPAGDTPGGVLWKAPLGRKLRTLRKQADRLYVGAETGELVIVDAKTGRLEASVKIAEKNLSVEHVDEKIVIATSDQFVYGLEAGTGRKKWEYPTSFRSREPPTFFKGVVVVRTGEKQLSVLDGATGTLLWQYAGKRVPGVFTTEDSLFVSEEEGIKEYAVETTISPGITDKEVFAELASTYLQQGNLDEASWYVNKITREIDPAYPQARYLQAHVLKARGDRRAAVRELITSFNLFGSHSRLAQDIMEELKREHGLLWQAETQADPCAQPREVQGKLMNLGGACGSEVSLYALDPANGKVIWRHTGQRFLVSCLSAEAGLIFYVTGDEEQPQRMYLFSVNIATGERKQLAALNATAPVMYAAPAASGRHVYVGAFSQDIQAQKNWAHIFALDRDTGTRLWDKANEVGYGKSAGFFEAQGEYLAYSVENELWIVQGATGTVHAHQSEETSIVPHFRISPEGGSPAGERLYYATGDQSVVFFNLADKKVEWRVKVAGLQATRLLSTDHVRGSALFDSDGDNVFCVDLRPEIATEKRIKWRRTAEPGTRFRRPLFAGDRLFAYRDDNILLELDPSNGQILAEFPLLWEPSGVVVQGNVGYVFTGEGRAYSLRLGETKEKIPKQ